MKTRLTVIGATLSLFIFSQFLHTRSAVIYQRSLNTPIGYWSATTKRLTSFPFSTQRDLSSNGWTLGMLKSAIFSARLLNLHKQLSDSEISEIQSFIDSAPPLMVPDSIRNQNSGKNVILIVVESLNAEAITLKLNGRPVAPTMLSMLSERGTISALDIVSQIQTGGSGDGQLIINTGLLPLPLFSTAISLGSSNRFIALPETLDRADNLVIFGDDAASWNERNTFSSYGFKRVMCKTDYQQSFPGRSDDEALLLYAADRLPTLRQPFFLELLTVSMHVPFLDSNIPQSKLNRDIQNSTELPEVVRNYLTMVNFFDRSLHTFIERLKQQGLYDNTILIIVSDHSQEIASLNATSISDTPMAFIATNTGITETINRKIGQIDIFPTILDICAPAPTPWRGLGTTMLNPQLQSAYLPEEGLLGHPTPLSPRQSQAHTISESILRSNYFSLPL